MILFLFIFVFNSIKYKINKIKYQEIVKGAWIGFWTIIEAQRLYKSVQETVWSIFGSNLGLKWKECIYISKSNIILDYT